MKWLALAALALAAFGFDTQTAMAGPSEQGTAPLPNFVIVYADDLGYGDLGCFGAVGIRTPNLDRMAQEGRRFTSFCVAQGVCSASRTALLTGCYPNRVGILGALGPQSRIGISDEERTIAQVLKQRGYHTAIFGKWHLGHHRRFLPTHHGFDEYLGLPYSNDMGPRRSQSPDDPRANPPLPLIEGDRVVEKSPDISQLTTRYTERAVKFIDAHHNEPFFLYVPHTMPHVPLGVSSKFRGKSDRGLYGDVIEEIDWSVGQILTALDRHGLNERTLVIFASDNGPWLSYGDHAGSAGPLREGKGTTWEGGVREPCVMRWTGKIPAGTTCTELAATIDILPTFAALAGAAVSSDRIIDGKDIRPLIFGEQGAKCPHEAYYYYWNNGLEAIRSGPWKLHFPHTYRSLKGKGGTAGKPAPYVELTTKLALYDLESDVGETKDVSAEHSDVVARMEKLAQSAREDLGDSLTKRKGKNVRPPGKL
ncbi:MAG TPA: sulfatase [Planctomycetaceae bacterium]|jgi:arylsulfatase A-like enzyme|nr:sulfatase [Planctomycetaceae bacterium]